MLEKKSNGPCPSSPLTFLLLQEVDGPLQDGGLVHFAWVALALQHCAQLLNEHIELVSPFLLGFIPGCPAHTHTKKMAKCQWFSAAVLKYLQEVIKWHHPKWRLKLDRHNLKRRHTVNQNDLQIPRIETM